MREHPIPQDIVGYRFHIVGSMTLKQFAELALGAIFGFIIYATNLPPVVKWPLIFVAGSLGAAAAFLPIEERPLDHWITTFFKTLYRPTKFYWGKSSRVPELFLFKAGEGVMEKKDEIDLSPIRRKRIKEYLASTKSISNYQDDHDLKTEGRINDIMRSFIDIVPDKIKVVKQVEKPDLKVRTRSLENLLSPEESITHERAHQSELEEKSILTTQQAAQTIEVPKTESTEVEVNIISDHEEVAVEKQQQTAYKNDHDVINLKSKSGESVVFNASLPFPSRPTTPNKLVGMILTSNSELISEAIVEIKDEQNRVVRAVKSNALGQFFISTPLKEGSYNIAVTHPKYQFNSQEITLKNELVEPIEVRSLN